MYLDCVSNWNKSDNFFILKMVMCDYKSFCYYGNNLVPTLEKLIYNEMYSQTILIYYYEKNEKGIFSRWKVGLYS